jgi:predicted aconitase with swiveling domain
VESGRKPEDRMILKGKKVVGGKVEGVAIVSEEDISFSGIDPVTGVVREKGHPIEGQSVSGKILVFPTGTGSTGGAYVLYGMAKEGVAPIALLVVKADEITVVGAIMGNIPLIHRLNKNIARTIKTGDRLKIDADNGIVEMDP